MTKNTKYTVHAGSAVARFSSQGQAFLFALTISKHLPGHLIEISDKTGLIGQYRNGHPTPEFRHHPHDAEWIYTGVHTGEALP